MYGTNGDERICIFTIGAYNLAKNPTSKTDVVGLDNMAFKKIVWMTRFSLDASSCIAQKCEVIMRLDHGRDLQHPIVGLLASRHRSWL